MEFVKKIERSRASKGKKINLEDMDVCARSLLTRENDIQNGWQEIVGRFLFLKGAKKYKDLYFVSEML